MRRGGEDELLAISPPPEFQDNPALPPPVLFRDLSPSANANNNPDARKISLQKCIKEFADKVSYNILNEAMIIATLIPSPAGINEVKSQASTPSFPISSGDSYSSDTISTCTSWEYLEKSNSVSDLRCLRGPSYLVENSRRKIKDQEQESTYRSQLRKSNSDALSTITTTTKYRNPASAVSRGIGMSCEIQVDARSKRCFDPSNSKTNIVKTKITNNVLVRKKTSTTANTPDNCSFRSVAAATANKSSSPLGRERETDADADGDDNLDVCYNVPFQCDIYSLPVDSLTTDTKTKTNTKTAVERINKNKSSNNCRKSQGKLKRGSSNNSTCNKTINNENCNSNSESLMVDLGEENSVTRRTPRNKRTVLNHLRKNTVSVHDCAEGGDIEEISQNKIGTGVGIGSSTKPASRLSERNNNENVTGDKMRSSKKRRSRSVEIDGHNTLNQRKLIQSTEAQSTQLGEFSSSKGKRNFGHTLLNLFRRNRPKSKTVQLPTNNDPKIDTDRELVLVSRALPPPPPPDLVESPMAEHPSPLEPRDFAASIEKVKDCGWYWGPLASDEAEDLLRGEPDGSFIVRDSSDSHYIFSLTFKLNGLVRHVRIEHDQGNFSFGPLTRFKAATIVEFVEKAVAHSRSGRYLFFLHRRPVLGPMQVQLLHPYSRFRHPRSLQHMCRFVILKYVRRDLLNTLPLPRPLQDYLNTPHYYFEQQELSVKNT